MSRTDNKNIHELIDEELSQDSYGDDYSYNDSAIDYDSGYEDKDFNALDAEPEKDYSFEVDEETLAAIEAQASINRQSHTSSIRGPGFIELIDDPIEVDDEETENVDAGDRALMRFLVIFIAVAVLVIVAGGVTYLVNSNSDSSESASGGPTEIGTGQIIDDTLEDVDVNGSGSGSGSGDSNVNVPDGGSLVEYSVTAEGEIGAASTTYLSGSGAPTEETGISLPWSQEIGARPSLTPHFIVAANGYGTLTCTITSDGEEIASNTTAGDSPTVECQA